MTNRIAVITASSGSNPPVDPTPYEGVDYHAFLEGPSHNDIWNVHPVIHFSTDERHENRRNAKLYKIVPSAFLPDYDYYIWIDATHKVLVHPQEIIDQYLTHSDIAVFKHDTRDCVYAEAEIIIKEVLDHQNLVENQMNYYSSMGYPEHNGLYELPVRIQRNTEETRRLGWMWWEHICRYSSRDQLSFPYVCNYMNVKPTIMPGDCATIGGNDLMGRIIYSTHRRSYV